MKGQGLSVPSGGARDRTRWRKNDDEVPDFRRMAKAIEAQALADIARTEKSEVFARQNPPPARRAADDQKFRLGAGGVAGARRLSHRALYRMGATG